MFWRILWDVYVIRIIKSEEIHKAHEKLIRWKKKVPKSLMAYRTTL